MHLLKVAMPTLRKVCNNKIKINHFEKWDESINKILRDYKSF